jgi:hypothetical protein
LDGPFRTGERAEAEARTDPPFDRTVILLDNIVEIRDHAAATSLAQCLIPVWTENSNALFWIVG